MNITKRIILCTLIVALAAAMVPLWNRTSALPCLYVWRYAIAFAQPGRHALLPDATFPGFPPLCTDVIRRLSNAL